MRILNIMLALSVIILAGYLLSNVKNAYYPRIQAFEQKEIPMPVLLDEVSATKQAVFKTKPLFNTYVKKAQLREKEDYVLLGVSIGNKNLAMIKDTVGNKDYYCTEGDKIGVFRVKRIFKDKVILESDQDTLVLTQ